MTSRIKLFRKAVYDYYQHNGRKDLPWRLNTAPWGVLLSEFMLQQTQVDRVVPYWERWLHLWPAPARLAAAPLKEALQEWSGLGYNRRCLNLWETARRITAEFNGVVPQTPAALVSLAGIGPYCAGAIACFAYNHPSVFIETNIRAAVLFHFFEEKTGVKDSELNQILEDVMDRENPRLWYWALMDYGAMIKKSTANPNRRSAHYVRQSQFEGSFRQRRGQLLRALIEAGPSAAAVLQQTSGLEAALFYQVAESLERDLLVCCRGGIYMIGKG